MVVVIEDKADAVAATIAGLLLAHRASVDARAKVRHLATLILSRVIGLISFVFQEGTTTLMMATRSGYCEVVQVLLEARAAVDLIDIDGCTALHTAASLADEPIVRMLLTAGADPNRTLKVSPHALTLPATAFSLQNSGLSPLMLALSVDDRSPKIAQMMQLLIAAKADANLQDDVIYMPVPLDRYDDVST
jgi:ankyrin repeat protein